MSDEIEHAVGRRLADTVNRWSTAALSLMSSLLLGIIVVNYGDMPKEIRALREAIAVLQVELRVVKDQQYDLIEANRINLNWRERLVETEQKVDRQTDRLAGFEKRLDKVEDRRSFFGNSDKK